MDRQITDILSTFIKDESVVSMFINQKALPYWKKGFTHESINYNHNYEKYEFLGDAGVGYAFSIYLREDLGIIDHGINNNLLTYYMSKAYQPIIARKMGLDKLILISPEVKITDDIIEDIFESFFGVFEMLCRSLRSSHPDTIKPASEYIRNFFRWYFKTHGEIDLKKGELVNKNFFNEYYFFLANESTQTKYSWYYNTKLKIFIVPNPQYLITLSNYNKELAKKVKVVFNMKGFEDENYYIDKVVSLLKSYEYDTEWLKFEQEKIKFDDDIKILAKLNGLTRFILQRNEKDSYDLLAQKTDPKSKKSITKILESFDTSDFNSLKESSVKIIRSKFSSN
jgi:hypothetical protein